MSEPAEGHIHPRRPGGLVPHAGAHALHVGAQPVPRPGRQLLRARDELWAGPRPRLHLRVRDGAGAHPHPGVEPWPQPQP